MAKRFFNISAIAVIFFLQAATLIYACPYFYSSGVNTLLAFADRAPENKAPCGETEKDQSASHCYQMPYSLVSSPSTVSSFSSSLTAIGLLGENAGLARAPLSHASVVKTWTSFSSMPPVFLYQILRI